MIIYYFAIMTKSPLYLDGLRVGLQEKFPSVNITQDMRDEHVRLYGEDWPAADLDQILKEGIVPSTLIISILGGQMGASNWLGIKFMKGYDAKFVEPIKVGDSIHTINTITDVLPHKDPAKDYGYASVHQDVFNQDSSVVYTRDLRYAIRKSGE